MSMFRSLLMQKQRQQSNDLAEVYAYADSIGVTPQQVDAALADKPAIIREKLIAWKYLIHSLINTGYTPWLKGDGVAYIETDITPVSSSYVDIHFTIETGGAFICGARGTSSQRYVIYVANRYVRNDWASGAQNNYPTRFAAGTPIQVYEVAGYGAVDGVEYTFDNVSRSAYGDPLLIYTIYDKGSVRTEKYAGKISSVKFSGLRDSVAVTGHFVPYLDNGSYGMLDLVTGTFYGSAVPNGLFAYILEDSNGNTVNLN